MDAVASMKVKQKRKSVSKAPRDIIDRANATSLPAIYQWPDMAEDGGLIAYGRV
jgi:hypothetical protein